MVSRLPRPKWAELVREIKQARVDQAQRYPIRYVAKQVQDQRQDASLVLTS